MAFGFPASYKEVLKAFGTRNDCRAAVAGVLESLGWDYERSGPDLFTSDRPMNPSSLGERLAIWITDEGKVEIESTCMFFQIFDWGRNKQNVRQFSQLFEIRNIREAVVAGNEPKYVNESGSTPVGRMISSVEQDVD